MKSLRPHFTPETISPVDKACTLVRQILVADPTVMSIVQGRQSAVEKVDSAVLINFMPLPRFVIWPSLDDETPGAGTVTVKATVNVAYRWKVDSLPPTADWEPSQATVITHLKQLLRRHQTLMVPVQIVGATERRALARRVDFGPIGVTLERNDQTNEGAVQVQLQATYDFLLDPTNGQPWNLSLD